MASFLHDSFIVIAELLLRYLLNFPFFLFDCSIMFAARGAVFFHVARFPEPGASESEGDDGQSSGALRRACSLSDLSKPSPRRLLPSPPNNGIILILSCFIFDFSSLFSCYRYIDRLLMRRTILVA